MSTILKAGIGSLIGRVRARFQKASPGDFILNASNINSQFLARGIAPLAIDPHDAEASPAGAARYIIANLVCNRALRRHYPTALTDGTTGEFADYILEGLSPRARDHAAACFAQPPGEPAKRVLEVREDLRELYPLALTPSQRHLFLAWLLDHGQSELGVTPEAALWILLEIDESPDRGLVPSYLMQPIWQDAEPLGLTVVGWPKLIAYLRTRFGIAENWLTNAKLRSPLGPCDELRQLRQQHPQLFHDFPASAALVPAWLRRTFAVKHVRRSWRRNLSYSFPQLTQPGVNVIGHYRYPSGLQEACAGVVRALEAQHLRVAKRDLPVHFPADWRDRERYQSLELFDTTIYVAAVNTFPREYFRRSGLRMREGVRRIAVWYWEVDRIPAEWQPELGWASEVWAPTTFLAEAYRKCVSVPVVTMLPGLSLPEFERKPRQYFDLPSERKLMLFSFDMGSVMERKNPLGLIEAYKRAFRDDDRVHLCIKVSRGEYGDRARLKAACNSVGATLIDRVLPREDVLALLANADCYASLHRAEGLGLGLAESMLLGVPVLGTAYSGNLDFMTPANSYLVNATTVPVGDIPPYPPDSVWAEPDLDHAAAQLRAVFADDARFAIAERGRRDVAELLSVDAAGLRMLARLQSNEPNA